MTTMRNFHVPLPEAVYHQLRNQAEQNKCPATELARNAIESWLNEQEQKVLHQAIAKYARRNAGSKVDLAEDVEDAAVEFLLSAEKK